MTPRALATAALLVFPTLSAFAQVGVYYVETVGRPTYVYAGPSEESEVLDTFTTSVLLESVGAETGDDGNEYEVVVPLRGTTYSWSRGYVRASDVVLRADERPTVYGFGAYGTFEFATIGAHSLAETSAANPLGAPGRAPTVGAGLSASLGKYVPVGGLGGKVRGLVDFSYVGVSGETAGAERTETFLVRMGLGGDLVWRTSPNVDLAVSAVPTGALYSQGHAVGADTLRYQAYFAGVDLSAGLGLGRSSFSGVGLRLEGGYRLATRMGGWEATWDRSGTSTRVDFVGDEPVGLSGPFGRVVVGFNLGGVTRAPTVPGVTRR